MKKAMKRGFSLVLTLLMLLCVFPVSTAFAADCTLTVGKDSAAVRAEAHDYGEIVERYAKGKSVTYTRLYINDALNLWYGIPIDGGWYKYIYSGNVKKVSNGAKVSAVVEMSLDLLNKQTCLEQAKKLLATGYKKDEIKKELYAHARI